MKALGNLLMAVGVVAILVGIFLIDVTVDVSRFSSDLITVPTNVANLHAMHIQSLVIHGGFASFIAGVIALGFGTIEELVKGTGSREPSGTEASRRLRTDQDSLPASEEGGTQWGVIGVVAAIILVLGMLAYFTSPDSRSVSGRKALDDELSAARNEVSENAAEAAERALDEAANLTEEAGEAIEKAAAQ